MNEAMMQRDVGGILDDSPQTGAMQVENPVLFAHRLLRGRYIIAVVLAMVMGAGLALAAYQKMEPQYTSQGLVRVAPTIPKILYESEENQVPPMFDSFVSAQATFMQSRRVLEKAVSDPDLQDAGWPSGAAGVGALQSSLDVGHRPNEQLIHVSVTHREPVLAQRAVNAVLDAYQELHGEQSGISATQKERTLEQRARNLQRELESLRQRILDLAEGFGGAETLDQMHASKVEELSRLDSRLTELTLRIAETESRDGSRAPTSDADADDGGEGDSADDQAEGSDSTRWTYEGRSEVERASLRERLAAHDSILADLMNREMSLESELRTLRGRFGPEHMKVKDLRRRLSSARSQIDERVQHLLQTVDLAALESAPQSEGDGETVAPGATLSELRTMRERYERMRERVSEEAKQLGRRRLEIASLESQIEEQERLLDETRRRLEQLRVESQNTVGGRVSIAARGDRPVSPSSDKRLPAAAAAGMFGAGFGVGLVGLYGLLNPCCRYADDVERSNRSAPMLGMLPDLTRGQSEHQELAEETIHQVRNLLELQKPRADGRESNVFAVTSPASGEGKTTLTLALGMSYAAAGKRTLLIDGDLIGRGLSRQLRIDHEQGLRTVITGGGAVNGEARTTRVENLWAMPAGSSELIKPKNLSRERMVRLVEQVRGDFDVVLIDTGPVLGSLEANLLCGLADSTILTVSRGQRSKLVQAAVERIGSVGGRCAGMVFNRAEVAEYLRSASYGSLSGGSRRSRRTTEGSGGAASLVRIAPDDGGERDDEPAEGQRAT